MDQRIFESYKKILLSEFNHIKKDGSTKALIFFQTRHKYLLMAFHPVNQKAIGRAIATHHKRNKHKLFAEIESLLVEAVKFPPSVGAIINALTHMFGHFRGRLTSTEKEDFLSLLRDLQ